MDVENIPAYELEAHEFGFWLARWRGFCGFTLKTVEHGIGISATKLSRVEAGEIVLTPSERFVLLDYLGCEVRKVIETTGGRIFIPMPAEDLHKQTEPSIEVTRAFLVSGGQT